MSILERPFAPTEDESGVRTYRGRSLEQLLPRIREDLGADAVILRQRDGLLGGVGGFFATRFVEVEARAGVPEVDAGTGGEEVPIRSGGGGIDVYDEDDTVAPEPGFSHELTAAMTAWTDAAAEEPVTVVTRPIVAMPRPLVSAPEPVAVIPSPAAAAPEPVAVVPSPAAVAPQPVAGDSEPAAATAAPAPSESAVGTVLPEPPAAPAMEETRAMTRATPKGRPAPAVSAASGRAVAASPPATSERAVAASPPATTKRGRPKRPRNPAAPHTVDPAAATAVVSELTGLGASPAFAAEIVACAAAHPVLSGGGLRAGARAELARRIRPAASLPAAGAAVAFVGAGGSGKTQAAAALACGYRHASSLAVSVLTLTDEYSHRRLADLLAGDEVPATRGVTRLATLRRSGMVVLDTPAVAPSDPAAVAEMATTLGQLALDATYAVLPATLSPAAARRALAGLAILGLDGIVISHADESDQLATLIELADAENLPVAFVTAGADHRHCLIGADPAGLAQVLLS